MLRELTKLIKHAEFDPFVKNRLNRSHLESAARFCESALSLADGEGTIEACDRSRGAADARPRC